MANVPPPPRLVVRPHRPERKRRLIVLLAVLWVASLMIASGVISAIVDHVAVVADRTSLLAVQSENETLRQHAATLERSEQVARAANADLQQTLRDHQEQIAGLRADLAFYSRLTGGSGKRDGLNVHGVRAQSTDTARVYNITVTLTQNLRSGQIAAGRVRLDVSGVRGGKLTTLAWTELAPDQDSNGLAFSFKYFQQVKATVMLQEGFVPNRIRVQADAAGDMGRADQDFAWSEAVTDQESPDVQQQP
jgi:hypothetical protein